MYGIRGFAGSRIKYSLKSIREVVLTDDTVHMALNSNDNSNVAYLKWDGNQWILNWNWLENDFNRNDLLVRARNFRGYKNSSLNWEEFVCRFVFASHQVAGRLRL